MNSTSSSNKRDRLIASLNRVWKDENDHILIERMVRALDAQYDLLGKITKEPGVEEIISQMVGRLTNSFERISSIQGKRVLDIACGSNSSKAPASLYINKPIGEMTMGRRAGKGYTALFEPWFCRILFELGANPVGVDFGDMEPEVFEHYRVDLGVEGSLDFLPDHSFDAVQDSRLFGSPEFTAQFPNQADRVKIAQEIRRQEVRLLKVKGIIIHSDANSLLQ
jgi:hypothetical protein